MNAPEPSPDSRSLPDCALLRVGKERRDSGALAYPPRLRVSRSAAARFVGAVGAKLDDQKRAAVGQKPHRGDPLGARELGQMMVEALQRLRAML